MKDPKKPATPSVRSGRQLGRKSKHTFVTKSGQTIKLHRNLVDKLKARRAAYADRRAARLAGMPKSRVKRFFYRMHPKRLYKYWFSREGAIMALKITGIGIISGFLLLVGLFAYFRKDLPNLHDIAGASLPGSIQYYDRTNTTLLWEDFDAVKRIPVEEKNISQFVKDATIAIEDKDFFKHGGFDVRGIVRAAWNNVFGGSGGTQGGSTITQQLVRLTQGVGKEQTYTRKIKELILSVELERSYSKKEILGGYLNTAPYGNVQYGVETAARDYFEKSAKDLTLEESAFLAAIPKSPSFYSPYGPNFNPEALVGRQHYILDLMEQQGMITKQQRDDAKKIDILTKYKEPKQKFAGIKAPYFVLAAKEQLEARFTEQTVKRGGWRVITTLDLNLQNIADEEVQKGLVQVRRQGGDTAAFVAEDVKTGQVVAMVGGADFNDPDHGEFNFARTHLPPGSSFKPYDYTALIEHTTNFGAGSVLYDSLGPVDGYPCTTGPRKGGNCLLDYDFRFPGPLTLRYALGGSRNVPAVKAMLIAGIDKTMETAHNLMTTYTTDGKPDPNRGRYKCFRPDLEDISNAKPTDETQCYASSAIGDGAYLKLDEHVHGFATLSRNGVNLPQTYILKIQDAASKTIDEWKPSKGNQAVRADTAYIVSDMLADPNASYFSRKPHRFNGHKFSLKTGTTNDTKDGLLMGYSPQYSAGVWVGYHNRRIAMRGFMETMTQPIWQGWMNRVHESLQPEERPRPASVKTLAAYVVRTHVGVGSVEPSPSTDLYPDWYKQTKRTTSTKRTIDVVSNKLATDCTPARARKEVTDTAADVFSGDRFVNPGGTTEGSDDIHKCDDVKPSISITSSPSSCSGSCTIGVSVAAGTHALSSSQFNGTINVIIDDQIVQSYSAPSAGGYSLTFSYSGSGDKTVSAEIVDSVLYDDRDSVTIEFGGGGGGSLALDTASASGTTTKFKWSGGTGTVTVYKASNNQALCSGNNPSDDDCQTGILNAPVGTAVYAKDSSGNVSSQVTVSGP